jgi:hypothetical protein
MRFCYIDNDYSLLLNTTCTIGFVEVVSVEKIINLCFLHPYRVIATIINITLFNRIKYEHK